MKLIFGVSNSKFLLSGSGKHSSVATWLQIKFCLTLSMAAWQHSRKLFFAENILMVAATLPSCHDRSRAKFNCRHMATLPQGHSATK